MQPAYILIILCTAMNVLEGSRHVYHRVLIVATKQNSLYHKSLQLFHYFMPCMQRRGVVTSLYVTLSQGNPGSNIVSSLLLCSHSVPWLDEGPSMLLPHLPILHYPLPDGTLPPVVV